MERRRVRLPHERRPRRRDASLSPVAEPIGRFDCALDSIVQQCHQTLTRYIITLKFNLTELNLNLSI